MPITIIFSAHESLMHRLRSGHATTDESKRYAEEVSDAALDRIVRAGGTHVHIACYKGFGLSYEQETIDRAADFIRRAKERGLKSAVYTQGPVIYQETFLQENPEAEDWLAKTYLEQPRIYCQQTFRQWTCVAAEGFIQYQEKMLRTVVERTKPDTVFMDNTLLQPPPFDCHCPHCQKAFQEYLNKQMGDRLSEIGLVSLDGVRIPNLEMFRHPDSLRDTRDPVLQQYLLFRLESLKQFQLRMNSAIKEQNPDILFRVNAGTYAFTSNVPLKQGQWFETSSAASDFWTVEEQTLRPRFEANGQVVTKARINKVGEFCGRVIPRPFWGEKGLEDYRITIGEILAFARGKSAGRFNLAQPWEQIEPLVPVYNWARNLEDKIDAGEMVAPIAVARLLHSQLFKNYIPLSSAYCVEQALFEAHLPFTIATDSLFERLDEFDAVILPEMSAISDKQLDALWAWIEKGGGLVLIGDAATTDEYLRPRLPNPLADLFPPEQTSELVEIASPHWVPKVNVAKITKPMKAALGKGKVTWLPRLLPGKDGTHLIRENRTYRVPVDETLSAEKATEVLENVRSVLRKPLPIEVEGAPHLLAEYRKTEDALFVHLNNVSKEGPAEKTLLRSRLAGSKKAIVSPMEEESVEIAPQQQQDGETLFELPPIQRYALVEIPLQ